MIQSILNVLFPMDCVLCGSRVIHSSSGPLCPDCEGQLTPLEPPFCNRCGLPAPAIDGLCGGCLSRAHRFDFARTALAFDPKLRELIHHFKYNDRVSLARPFGRALKACFEGQPFTAEVAIPVPLHRRRGRRRGYNQAALLASQLGLQTEVHAVRRRRNTESQTGLTRSQRVLNVRHAFECSSSLSGAVLIVDDVLTTGATINELARVLRRNGAQRVEVLTLTRAGTETDSYAEIKRERPKRIGSS